jgi:hypothetical protein
MSSIKFIWELKFCDQNEYLKRRIDFSNVFNDLIVWSEPNDELRLRDNKWEHRVP